MDVNDMIRDEDLIVQNSHGNGINQRLYVPRNIQQLVANMVPSVIAKRPSPREMNLLKRKAKVSSKDQAKGWSEDGDMEVPYTQNTPTLKGSCPDTLNCEKVFMLTCHRSYLIFNVMLFNLEFIRSDCETSEAVDVIILLR